MKGIVSKIAPVSIAALAILGLTAPGASAQVEAPSSSANIDENSNANVAEIQASNPAPDMPEPEEGSVFYAVANASDTDEQRAILEAEGFEATTGPNGEETYEQTADGITIGWTIEPESSKNEITPQWGAGIGRYGPYVSATTEQWQNLATNAGIIGTAACTLIGNAFGAFGCAAAAGIVSNQINSMEPNSAPTDCWALHNLAPVMVLPASSC